MYRVFTESLDNYINSFGGTASNDIYRLKITEPLELIKNIELYLHEKHSNSLLFQKVSDLLYNMEQNVQLFPKFKAFLWTLEARGMVGKYYGVVPVDELKEQMKLINSFLGLMYWTEANQSN